MLIWPLLRLQGRNLTFFCFFYWKLYGTKISFWNYLTLQFDEFFWGVRVEEEETISFPVRARGADFWGEKLTFNYFLNGRWFLSCVIFEMSFKSFHGFSFAPEQMSSNGSVWLFFSSFFTLISFFLTWHTLPTSVHIKSKYEKYV